MARFRTLGILSLLVGACAPEATRLSPDPGTVGIVPAAAANRWVDSTLATLTLRERVAQMVVPWTGGEYVPLDSPDMDRLNRWVDAGVGGVIVSVGLPHSYAAKLNRLQRRAKVPLLVTSDLENGPGMRLGGVYSLPHLLPQGGGTGIPSAMAMGAAASDSLAYEAGRVTGVEARAVGIHLTFGPVLDVNNNPRNPIINTRSFGEDPAEVGRLAAAWIRGARSVGLLTTGKHFPGHGDTETDSHLELPTIHATRARLDSTELPPFRAAVAAGTDAMLIAHIALPGVDGPDAPPATLSPELSTRMLRTELGFGGLVVTDAMTMGGVVRRFGPQESLVLAVQAGADVLLMPREVDEAIRVVTEAVQAGRIPATRIEQSVRRILLAKYAAGLATRREVELEAVDSLVGSRTHVEVARRIAERSITLARDSRGLVPLAAGARRVLVITYADAADLVAGRIFRSTLADGGLQVDAVRLDERTTDGEINRLRARADSADLVIAAAHVQPRESRGSIATEGGFSGIVQGLSAAGRPLVAVSFGSPYLLDAFPAVPAYLLAWSGSEASQRAAAEALLGRIAISGRLPVALPPHLRRGEGLQRAIRGR